MTRMQTIPENLEIEAQAHNYQPPIDPTEPTAHSKSNGAHYALPQSGNIAHEYDGPYETKGLESMLNNIALNARNELNRMVRTILDAGKLGTDEANTSRIAQLVSIFVEKALTIRAGINMSKIMPAELLGAGGSGIAFKVDEIIPIEFYIDSNAAYEQIQTLYGVSIEKESYEKARLLALEEDQDFLIEPSSTEELKSSTQLEIKERLLKKFRNNTQESTLIDSSSELKRIWDQAFDKVVKIKGIDEADIEAYVYYICYIEHYVKTVALPDIYSIEEIKSLVLHLRPIDLVGMQPEKRVATEKDKKFMEKQSKALEAASIAIGERYPQFTLSMSLESTIASELEEMYLKLNSLRLLYLRQKLEESLDLSERGTDLTSINEEIDVLIDQLDIYDKNILNSHEREVLNKLRDIHTNSKYVEVAISVLEGKSDLIAESILEEFYYQIGIARINDKSITLLDDIQNLGSHKASKLDEVLISDLIPSDLEIKIQNQFPRFDRMSPSDKSRAVLVLIGQGVVDSATLNKKVQAISGNDFREIVDIITDSGDESAKKELLEIVKQVIARNDISSNVNKLSEDIKKAESDIATHAKTKRTNALSSKIHLRSSMLYPTTLKILEQPAADETADGILEAVTGLSKEELIRVAWFLEKYDLSYGLYLINKLVNQLQQEYSDLRVAMDLVTEFGGLISDTIVAKIKQEYLRIQEGTYTAQHKDLIVSLVQDYNKEGDNHNIDLCSIFLTNIFKPEDIALLNQKPIRERLKDLSSSNQIASNLAISLPVGKELTVQMVKKEEETIINYELANIYHTFNTQVSILLNQGINTLASGPNDSLLVTFVKDGILEDVTSRAHDAVYKGEIAYSGEQSAFQVAFDHYAAEALRNVSIELDSFNLRNALVEDQSKTVLGKHIVRYYETKIVELKEKVGESSKEIVRLIDEEKSSERRSQEILDLFKELAGKPIEHISEDVILEMLANKEQEIVETLNSQDDANGVVIESLYVNDYDEKSIHDRKRKGIEMFITTQGQQSVNSFILCHSLYLKSRGITPGLLQGENEATNSSATGFGLKYLDDYIKANRRHIEAMFSGQESASSATAELALLMHITGIVQSTTIRSETIAKFLLGSTRCIISGEPENLVRRSTLYSQLKDQNLIESAKVFEAPLNPFNTKDFSMLNSYQLQLIFELMTRDLMHKELIENRSLSQDQKAILIKDIVSKTNYEILSAIIHYTHVFTSTDSLMEGNSRTALSTAFNAAELNGMPNVHVPYGIGTIGEVPFCLLPYICGCTLDKAVERGIVNKDNVLDVLQQIAIIVKRVNDAGITQSDLKTTNVFIEQINGKVVVKISDYDIASHHLQNGDANGLEGNQFFTTLNGLTPQFYGYVGMQPMLMLVMEMIQGRFGFELNDFERETYRDIAKQYRIDRLDEFALYNIAHQVMNGVYNPDHKMPIISETTPASLIMDILEEVMAEKYTTSGMLSVSPQDLTDRICKLVDIAGFSGLGLRALIKEVSAYLESLNIQEVDVDCFYRALKAVLGNKNDDSEGINVDQELLHIIWNYWYAALPHEKQKEALSKSLEKSTQYASFGGKEANATTILVIQPGMPREMANLFDEVLKGPGSKNIHKLIYPDEFLSRLRTSMVN